jgi:putative ABC transport system permease protein
MRESDRSRRLGGPDPHGDVEDELSFHLEMRIRELVERGETPERARALALRRFGEYERSRDECIRINERRRRSMVRTKYASELRQDVGYAVRMLRRTPGFTLVALATLALGIGANSTIFSVVEGVLLEDLPYAEADRLYEVRTLYPDGTGYSLSAPDFTSLRADARAFERFEAFTGATLTMLGAGEPKEVRGAVVSDGLFELLGLRVVLGRGFLPEESRPGAGRVAVLDHGFWLREFGGRQDVLGRSLNLSGGAVQVVGVLAPDAALPSGGRRSWLNEADVYAPLAYDSTFSATTPVARRDEFLRVVARAAPGASAEQADADLRRIGAELQASFPQTNGQQTFQATQLREIILGDVRTPLLVLLGAVGFVLLVACANVANLVLARASARQGELAVRASLGAGRGRLLRQLLTEAAVLGLAGGAVGLLIAYAGTRALAAAQPADIPRLNEIGVDGGVVFFTLALALATGLAFGAIPALQATGRGLMGALREGARGGGGHRVRGGLVVAEMALAVVLLTGAGLLVRSFIALTRVEPGFEPAHALQLRVTMQGDDYQNGQQVRDRVDHLLEHVRALPGVAAVGGTTQLPFSGRGSLLNFAVDDAPPPPSDVNAEIGVVAVTPEYFDAMGMTVRQGRPFARSDHADAPPVAIVNEAAVRVWFGGQSPLGRRVTVGSANPEIVGVVADVLQNDPTQAALPELFRPYAQRTSRSIRIVVRAAGGDPLALVPALRGGVRELDPNLPVAEVAELDDLVAAAVARPRFYTALLTLFAAVGLALAATGIFGVMSYSVAQRAREISIRMALGARASEVLGMIVGRAMVLVAAGAGIGIAAALAFGRVLRSQLFGVDPVDPLTLVVVLVVLVASAALASFLPARRGASLDPAVALRSD